MLNKTIPMTYAPKEVYQADFENQKRFFTLMIFCYLGVITCPFGLYYQFLIGIIQVVSCLNHTT